MFSDGKIQKPAAVIFVALMILSVSGILAYFIWFSRAPAPPHRSRPVARLDTGITDYGNIYRQGLFSGVKNENLSTEKREAPYHPKYLPI